MTDAVTTICDFLNGCGFVDVKFILYDIHEHVYVHFRTIDIEFAGRAIGHMVIDDNEINVYNYNNYVNVIMMYDPELLVKLKAAVIEIMNGVKE